MMSKRVPKVSADDLQQFERLSDDHLGVVHYITRRASEQGLSEPVGINTIAEIARLGAALSELSVVLMRHYQLNAGKAQPRAELTARE